MQIVTPPSHILGLLNIATVLDTGGWLRLHRRFDIDPCWPTSNPTASPSKWPLRPSLWRWPSHPGLERYDLSSLRYIMWCATPVTESAWPETVTRRTGVSWVTAYGASELPVLACNELTGARLDTVGRSVPGVELRVVSLETGDPLPAGEVGEIQAQSNSVMAGYLPEADTAGAFLDGWYRTGDVGYIDADGWVRITDRAKEMIKVRGFQVAPAEIEAVLHGHPAVKDCAVFGVPDAADGEAVVAAVELAAAHAPVGADELIALVGDRLASYKRPRRDRFRPRDSSPALGQGVAPRAEGAPWTYV